jgi:N-acyl amino acid synthase of PEP-CTERM/exosortase system
MTGSPLEEAICKLHDEFLLELVDTPAALQEAYELRWQVYCVERGFLEGQNGVERDEYDDFARHAVLRWRQTGEVVGTVRVVLPKTPPGGDDFPLQHVCDSAVLCELPRTTIGEVSRFALAKQLTRQVRSMSAETCSLLRLALIRGAVWLSAEAGHTHWVAVMEPTLLRLLRATGIHFQSLGPPVEYHGLRQPAVAELVPTMARLAREQPVIWDFITASGTWYTPLPTKRQRVLEHAAA